MSNCRAGGLPLGIPTASPGQLTPFPPGLRAKRAPKALTQAMGSAGSLVAGMTTTTTTTTVTGDDEGATQRASCASRHSGRGFSAFVVHPSPSPRGPRCFRPTSPASPRPRLPPPWPPLSSPPLPSPASSPSPPPPSPPSSPALAFSIAAPTPGSRSFPLVAARHPPPPPPDCSIALSEEPCVLGGAERRHKGREREVETERERERERFFTVGTVMIPREPSDAHSIDLSCAVVDSNLAPDSESARTEVA